MRNLLAAAVVALALPVSAQEMSGAYSSLSAQMAASRQAMQAAAQQARAQSLGAVYYGSGAPAAKPAPDFDLPAPTGETHGLNDYFGKVIVVVFWANWSGPSKASAPARTAVARRYAGSNVQFLDIGVGETASGAASFAAASAPASAPASNEQVLLDSDQSVFAAYGGTSLPLAVVVDKEGNVAATISGADAGAIDAAVRAALR